MFCALLRPRYQVSVYRTIGPLVKLFLWRFSLYLLNLLIVDGERICYKCIAKEACLSRSSVVRVSYMLTKLPEVP